MWRAVTILAVLAAPAAGEELKAGDRSPTIELDSLVSGKRMTLKTEDGKLKFKDDKGKTVQPKATFILFSRSLKELATLQKVHEKYAKEGVLILLFANYDDPDEARELVKEAKATYPVFQGAGSEIAKKNTLG